MSSVVSINPSLTAERLAVRVNQLLQCEQVEFFLEMAVSVSPSHPLPRRNPRHLEGVDILNGLLQADSPEVIAPVHRQLDNGVYRLEKVDVVPREEFYANTEQ